MAFRVTVKKKVEKGIRDLPDDVRRKFRVLVKELVLLGPIRTNWPNFSALGKVTYHCHLKYDWVACWRWEKESIEIEVYYAGSRENAPY
jgi:mRNA-degrading endonuclease RelE of RelBE toxin-antitoxin system